MVSICKAVCSGLIHFSGAELYLFKWDISGLAGGWQVLSNRAEKQPCQCTMCPFPIEKCCTDAMHEFMHSVFLKEWIWLWV